MSAVHPSDQLHFFDRALAAMEKTGEPAYVIQDGRAMREELQRAIRGPSRPSGNLPATNTGD